jgi:glycosyltransferase involved in cell wall biosynthesis
MNTELTVIICTHNRYEVLNDAIASIETQDCPEGLFELLIVDNSTDLKAQEGFLHDADISCRHQIIVERVPGLSRARNLGVRAASGSVVAFMDDDARATPRWVASLVETMRETPQAGVVGGPVRPIWPSSRPPWLHEWLEGYLTIVDRGDEVRALAHGEWLAGTNISFRRELLLEAGLFNENLGRVGKLLLSNEELAVTERIRKLGYSVVYNPAVEMHHKVHADRLNQAWMRRRVMWQVISDLFSDTAGDPSLEADVGKILDFQMRLPPKDRGLSGLFLDVDSSELFFQQTEALARLVRLVATDGRDWRGFLETRVP